MAYMQYAEAWAAAAGAGTGTSYTNGTANANANGKSGTTGVTTENQMVVDETVSPSTSSILAPAPTSEPSAGIKRKAETLDENEPQSKKAKVEAPLKRFVCLSFSFSFSFCMYYFSFCMHLSMKMRTRLIIRMIGIERTVRLLCLISLRELWRVI